ncbi:hypothetical protein PHYBLDRAFT_72281 [Phycomyces blakesleeanus NRRL 1555(-)]|uniref:Uncharacterized protein n=1 Tax=Phycomyces blakesleeanus (strain ATCC 8743b / DSM 1359 / FGSC 10004 / NBRC 33097 / NRRL 1555) TaxID=763407 RepID=A0A162W942_PHYB8|nr:hypothetical protein PHYBLDRAFT_72281 [Phycomyces blakesleeanus NRRL 1555(-)]OAD65515.1 hypothetical protein PHYBLDRAFT_72281 [Phycomyces blakesleeanus NRRL 1555(-)]|eukprot:XP_018283555.1 hypothetical protein PHYBLDRAFT_72281 [Phycomyces blakesleeanus NRRL 1555(-)]
MTIRHYIIFLDSIGKHTLTLPLLHFYIPPFFFDTRVLTSDASSSQWPSGLAKTILPKILSVIKHSHENDEQPSLKHDMHQELSSHVTVIDMSKKIGTNAMFNISSVFLLNQFVSSVFNYTIKTM